MSSCDSKAGMGMSAPLINAIVGKCSFTPTHTSIRWCLKSFTSCTFSGRLAAPEFVIKCIEITQGCLMTRNLKVDTGLLHYCTFRLEAADDAQNVGRHSSWKIKW